MGDLLEVELLRASGWSLRMDEQVRLLSVYFIPSLSTLFIPSLSTLFYLISIYISLNRRPLTDAPCIISTLPHSTKTLP